MVRTTPIVPALLAGLALALTAPAQAADTEVRQFAVSIDGKPCGQYTMTFIRGDDGTLGIACDAHVKYKVALITAYHYDFTDSEVWKDGRVVSVKSRCDDDGKKFEVTAGSGERGLTVRVNGRERTVRGDAYLTTACCPPDARRRDGDIPLMEADNGAEIAGKIQLVSSGTMTVAGQTINGSRYRLTGLVPHDVWYDAAERMIRQEWTEDGHKTVLELTGIKKER